MAHGREIEIKLRAPEPSQARALLENHDFRPIRERVFETNEVYDTYDSSLRSHGQLVRLRVAGAIQTLTFKGQAEAGPHKSREELEVHLGPAENLGIIFVRLGFACKFRYEKYRTEFERAGEAGVVTLDETPIGNFFEIEGEPDWIDRVAGELGFGKDEFITASYGTLYRDWCREHKQEPRDMVF